MNQIANVTGKGNSRVKHFLRRQLPVGATVGPLPGLHSAAVRLHFHFLRSMSLTFFVSSLLFLRRNLPPAAAGGFSTE